MNYMKAWRADTWARSVELADVLDTAPLEKWLCPMHGDGQYAYFKTQKEATDSLIIELKAELQALKEEIEDLERNQ